jgi:hypothetical protein
VKTIAVTESLTVFVMRDGNREILPITSGIPLGLMTLFLLAMDVGCHLSVWVLPPKLARFLALRMERSHAARLVDRGFRKAFAQAASAASLSRTPLAITSQITEANLSAKRLSL